MKYEYNERRRYGKVFDIKHRKIFGKLIAASHVWDIEKRRFRR